MNDLQHIPESSYGPVLVTLNPPFEANEYKVFGRWKYDHPVLDSKVSCEPHVNQAISPNFIALRLYWRKVKCTRSKIRALSRMQAPISNTVSTKMDSQVGSSPLAQLMKPKKELVRLGDKQCTRLSISDTPTIMSVWRREGH